MCKGFVMLDGREVEGAPIPAGYVVTGEVKSNQCSQSIHAAVTTNAWAISLPRANLVICKRFPLPLGFITVEERMAPGCPRLLGGKNAWLIQPTK
jgi:hypothetical protein